MADGTSESIHPQGGDVWSKWLLETRYAGDPAYERLLRADVERYRDRVLDGARLAPGMTMVDVGAGDGLLAFGAIARIGASLRVVLTDVSEPLLRRAVEIAAERGVVGQCIFQQGSAEKLVGLETGSMDAVCTRSALAYVADKRAALREFHRVLKAGGRISLAEPILQDNAFEAGAVMRLITAQPDHPDIAFLRLQLRWKAAQFPVDEEAIWRNPLTNYSERDLMHLAREVGFVRIHLELHLDARPSLTSDWEVFVGLSPHPWAPSLRAIMAEKFSAEERRLFERTLRPLVESGRMVSADAMAYLTAEKPAAAEGG